MLKKIITILIFFSSTVLLHSETKLSTRPVQASMTFNGQLFSTQSYEYDARGNLVKISENNYMEKKLSHIIYKYNPENRLTEMKEFRENTLNSIIIPEYNAEGKVIKKIHYSPDNIIKKYTVFEYDKNLLTRSNDYYSSDIMYSYSVLNYKDGILNSIHMCSINEYTMDLTVIYNSDRLIIGHKIKHSSIPDADFRATYEYEKGDITEASLHEIFSY